MCANFLRGYAKLPEPEDVIEDKPGRRVITKYVPIGSSPSGRTPFFCTNG